MRLSEFKAAVEALGASCIQNELMSKHTSFSVGGPADLFITVENAGIMTKLLPLAERYLVPLTVIGNGSNLLVSDKGVEGAVVKYCDRSVTVSGEKIICGAGAMLSAVSAAARDSSLGGMEFAYGIPGSIGGAVYMNAGAYGGEIKDVIESCISVDTDGTVIKREKHELMLGYRESIYKGNREVILSAVFDLKTADKAEISAKMDDYMARRRQKQPLDMPSAGSTFKRPTGYFAGALIEQCGLKGTSVGGAAVSEKHAGFIVNTGGATCDDIRRLIEKVAAEVLMQTGVRLEPEVIFIGR